jgi:hypothetical protein
MHPRQPDLESPLGDLLEEALADAGFNHDEGLLFAFDADRSATGFEAVQFPRGVDVGSDDIPEVQPLLAELNHSEARGAIRIVLFTGGRSEEGTAAIIRHELEHARQTDQLGGDLEGLYRLCADVLAVRGGGLHGSSVLYTLMPIEMDANAAGAMFATERYGRERIVELLRNNDRDGAALRCNVGPEPVETLPERMLAFMIANRGLCDLYADRHDSGLTFRQMLNAEWPGAGNVWRDLVEEGGLVVPR